MTVDLAALAKLASEATPGPWHFEDVSDGWDGRTVDLEDARGTSILSGWGYDAWGINVGDADAAYIAAASPDVVAALVRVALAAQETLSFIAEWAHDCNGAERERFIETGSAIMYGFPDVERRARAALEALR